MPVDERLGADDCKNLKDRREPAIKLDQEPAIAVLRVEHGHAACAAKQSTDVEAPRSGNDENHPKFDNTAVQSGRLYPKPALFFGMKDASKEDDGWRLNFLRAKKLWLENYLNQLRKGITPY